MINSDQCLAKWGTPKNTVAWQSRILSNWYADRNLTNTQLSEYRESCFPSKIYMNNLMHGPFTAAVINLIEDDNLHLLRTWDGCFNIRKIAGSNKWSTHSYGISFDIDAAWNKQGKPGDLSYKIVDNIKCGGFDWGGNFGGSSIDPMHFTLKEEFIGVEPTIGELEDSPEDIKDLIDRLINALEELKHTPQSLENIDQHMDYHS